MMIENAHEPLLVDLLLFPETLYLTMMIENAHEPLLADLLLLPETLLCNVFPNISSSRNQRIVTLTR
jgi:hypothetical protein